MEKNVGYFLDAKRKVNKHFKNVGFFLDAERKTNKYFKREKEREREKRKREKRERERGKEMKRYAFTLFFSEHFEIFLLWITVKYLFLFFFVGGRFLLK